MLWTKPVFSVRQFCRIFLVPVYDIKIHQIYPGVDLFSFTYWVGPESRNSVFQFREIFLNDFINDLTLSVFIYSLLRTPIIWILNLLNKFSNFLYIFLSFSFYSIFLGNFLNHSSSKPLFLVFHFYIIILISKSSFCSQCFLSSILFLFHVCNICSSLKILMRFLLLSFLNFTSPCLSPASPSCFFAPLVPFCFLDFPWFC